MRHSLRVQLTLLYAVPFFISGAALLSLLFLQTRQSVPVGQTPPGGPRGADPAPVHHLLVGSGLGLAALALLSLALGWFIAGRFLRPLRAIIAAARDISANNLHRRLGSAPRRGAVRRTEFTELADTLDDLFERLESAFESQRHFVANASHELRTPLTAERALLQVALADPGATVETLRAACQDVLALGQQQERLIEALLTLATGEQAIRRREPLDLAEIAGNAVAARRDEAARRGVRVHTALSAAPATGDPHLVASLVANLVENAVRYNVPGGQVVVKTGTVDGRASLTVDNTGPVIPPGEVDRLFQPFQRLGSARLGYGDGHGLGLAIVRAIADGHGATLTPAARPGGGLAIEVRLP